jgi:hypothetical protein
VGGGGGGVGGGGGSGCNIGLEENSRTKGGKKESMPSVIHTHVYSEPK